VGAVLGRDNESRAVHVREVPEGLGAERAGLLAGDEIVMIDGVYVRELGAKELRAHLRGNVGTTVDLTVIRGKLVRRVRLTRTELVEKDETKPREEKLPE
jgi:C-terminal processing protease CtpA/Prc